MATALQCPACGFKHRLDSVADTPVFPCSRCSRQLKLPSQYRAGAGAPSAPQGSRGPAPATPRVGGSARVDNARSDKPQGSGAGPRHAAAAARRIKPQAVGNGTVRVPLRILAWVVAFVLGALVVVQLSRWTGFVGGNDFVDVMIGGDFSVYVRLALLIPVWALVATVLATVFIEAPGWWSRRGFVGVTAASARSAVIPATPRKKPDAGGSKRSASVEPEPVTPARRVVPRAMAVERPEADAGTGSVQRPRRIPRRETGS